MSTTVRVRDEDKAILDQLQARLTLIEGTRPSLDEIIHRLVRLGIEDPVRLRQDQGPNLTDREIDALLALSVDMGVETDESTIDEELYGRRLHPT